MKWFFIFLLIFMQQLRAETGPKLAAVNVDCQGGAVCEIKKARFLNLIGDYRSILHLRETVRIRGSRTSADATPRAGTTPIRVGGNIRAPKKIRDVKPLFPASMRDAGLTGVVPVEALVGVDGSVMSLRVLSAQAHPDFAVAAVDAVRQWRFTPTLLNGQAVEVMMNVTITFDLD